MHWQFLKKFPCDTISHNRSTMLSKQKSLSNIGHRVSADGQHNQPTETFNLRLTLFLEILYDMALNRAGASETAFP